MRKAGGHVEKRVIAMLLSGMLTIGSISGAVFASEIQMDSGQTSENAIEETGELPSEEISIDASLEEYTEEDSSDASETVEYEIDDQTLEEQEIISDEFEGHDNSEQDNNYEQDKDHDEAVDENGDNTIENENEKNGPSDQEGQTVDDVILDDSHGDSDSLIIEEESPEEAVTTNAAMSVVASGTCGNHLTWTLDDQGTLTISGTGELCPDDDCWSEIESQIENVIIKNGITSIGDSAFSNFGNLTSITIPESVTSIGDDAFYGCPSLTIYGLLGSTAYTYAQNENIPYIAIDSGGNPFLAWGTTDNGLKWSIDDSFVLTIRGDGEIGDDGDISEFPWREYSDCIQTVVIESGITYIGANAFDDYEELLEVTISGDVEIIGCRAFEGCGNLQKVNLEKGLKRIDEHAFEDCGSLTSITMPDGVTSIGDSAFSSCSSLTSITIPDSVTSIGMDAFSNCSSLTSITIPSSVTNYGDYAFGNCSSLTSVTISEGATCIGYFEFEGCSMLTSIIIPDSVTSIGFDAFCGCPSLTIYGLLGSTAYTYAQNYNIPFVAICSGENSFLAQGTTDNGLSWSIDDSFVLTIGGDGEIGDEGDLSEFPWKEYSNYIHSVVVDSGITYIGANVFYDYEELLEVTISGDVEIIGRRAFAECRNLQNINLAKGLKRIDGGAFEECGSLTNITIPDSVTSIGHDAFYGCSSLTSITIPDGVTSIGNYAFSLCSSLASVTIPDSVTEIGHYAFEYCDSLTLYGSLQSEAFKYAEMYSIPFIPLVSDQYPYLIYGTTDNGLNWSIDDSFVLTIGGDGELGDDGDTYVFPWREYSDYIQTVVIESGITYIGANAFDYYEELLEVTISGDVEIIGRRAFEGCGNLQKVNLEKGLKRIDEHAFEDCGSLTSITIPDGVTSIGYSAFYDCSSLTSITIPDSVTSIGDYAFSWCSSLTNITIPDSVTSIGYSVFYGCSGLTSIRIPENVSYINYEAFFDCKGLSEVMIESTDIWIADGSFYYYNSRMEQNEPIPGLTISGYSGTEVEAYANANNIAFKSLSTSISEASITIPAQTYTGQALKPTININYKGTKLKLNTDYKVVFSNNTNAGTATATITGLVKFKGTKKQTFTISKAAQSITAKSSASSIAVGKTATVSITGNKGAKSYKSSNTTIATVTSAGKVTAKKVGTVKITATSAATSNYNAASKVVTIKVVPAATASITAANQATGIKLTWKKVTGATGYKVYRGSTLIKTITSGSTVTCTDAKANTNGTKYTFKIVPTASTGNGTAKSLATYRVVRPTIASVANSAASRMTVKWGKNAKATGYQIQCSTSKTFASGNKTATVGSAATVSKVFTSLTKGKTYYVRMRTYKTVGSVKYWSAWSITKALKISK